MCPRQLVALQAGQILQPNRAPCILLTHSPLLLDQAIERHAITWLSSCINCAALVFWSTRTISHMHTRI